jgi:hypothetical protein
MSNLLRKTKRHSVLDDPRRWSDELRPPYFDAVTFQSRLDARVGVNREGKSILRVVWAPKSIGLYGIPRYWVTRVRDGEGWKYTSVPRWVLESRVEKSQYAQSWALTRHAMTADDGYVPTEPPDDFYMFRWLCAEHEAPDPLWGQPKCCRRAWEPNRLRCWGTYRAPNDYDLACVSKALQVREQGRFIDAYNPLSVADLIALETTSTTQMEKLVQAEQAETAAMGRDFDRLHGWRLTPDAPTTHNRFFDVGGSAEKRVTLTDS